MPAQAPAPVTGLRSSRQFVAPLVGPRVAPRSFGRPWLANVARPAAARRVSGAQQMANRASRAARLALSRPSPEILLRVLDGLKRL